jgi:cytoskeleton protein RodZ
MAEIGATLRDARMRAKIDINEVETSTKIRAKYLRAIENEEWALLPGDVYVKSFLRTYGDYLGLDSRQLIDDYKRRYERPSDNDQRPIMPPGRERDRQSRGPRGPLVPPWALIGVVLVAIVVALYFLGRNKGGSPTTSTQTHIATGQTRKPPKRHRATTTPTRAAPTTVRLQLIPTGDVYVCLVDGSGKRLIPGEIFNVGQTIPAKTSSKLMLTLGNAAVKMKVNGASVPVPSTGSPVGFELLPTGHTLLPAGKQPQCT